MKHPQFHLLLVSLIVAGPFITLIAWLCGPLPFMFVLFPITTNSFHFWMPVEGFKETSYLRFVIPLFMLKVFVIGIISLAKLYRKQDGGSLLTRFYFLIVFILTFKLLAILLWVDFDWFSLMTSFVLLIWIAVLVVAIKKHRLYRRVLESVNVDNDEST